MVINQPVTQVRLTNVAVVRFNKGGCRFEIACYPNKVQDWRNGLEPDISEVLQSDKIFTNVAKGKFAPDNELMREFGTTDLQTVTKVILQKGTVQVSEKERRNQAQDFHKEICTLAASRLISKTTSLPLTAQMVENALKEIRYRPKYSQRASAKAAVAKVVQRLLDAKPDELIHALMRAEISCDVSKKEILEEFLDKDLGAQRLRSETIKDPGGTQKFTAEYRAAPGDWKKQERFVQDKLGGDASIFVYTMYDETTPDSLPEHNLLAKVDKQKEKEEENEVDTSESEQEESSDEEESSEEEEEEESTGPPRGKSAGFAALMSSDEDSDEEEDLAKTQFENLDELLKPEKKRSGAKRVDLENFDTRDRKARLKAQERKERDRERKEAEKAKLAKAEAAAKLIEQAEAARAEAKKKLVVPTGPIPGQEDQWCASCQCQLSTSLRCHAKSEFHLFNQKRRVRELEPITEGEFEDLSRDLKEGFLAVQH